MADSFKTPAVDRSAGSDELNQAGLPHERGGAVPNRSARLIVSDHVAQKGTFR
jgi:hypothetical protein